MRNDGTQDYDGLFSTDKIKRIFDHNGKIIKPWDVAKRLNDFDLKNESIYDYNTKELIKIGTQKEYNSQFLLKLIHMYVLDIHPFLDYHFKNTNDKLKFYRYVKYGMLESKHLEKKKEALKDWLKENVPKPQTEDGNTINEDETTNKENKKLVELVNNFELMAFYAIDEATKRITDKLSEKIKSQKTIEDKILYCKKEIKVIKQTKETTIFPEINYNPNDSFLDYSSIKFPNQTKILVNWLKTEIEYLKDLQSDEIKLSINSSKKPNFNQLKEDLLNKQNNLIPKVGLLDVYNHFKVLTEIVNNNDEFYLTPEQLLIFIQSVFVDKKPIKQDFNCKGFIKKTVRKIFYNFYFYNKKYETNHKRIKRKYFNIMNDSFIGFNETDYTDFSK